MARTIHAKVCPLETQIKKATCSLPDKFLRILLDNGIASYWGEVKNPPADTMFIGNVFLHPEEAKERWRLIFHPYWFNLVVKERRLHSVVLPRMRQIVKMIYDHICTVKVDLKCAFFQIPLERGIFVFRKKGKLYTLNRLPMGASISVLIAQTLSNKVAEVFTEHLGNASTGSKTSAFVDDIFCSFNPSRHAGSVEDWVTEAMNRTVKGLGVTLKLFHCYHPTADLVRDSLSNLVLLGPMVSQVGIRRPARTGELTGVVTLVADERMVEVKSVSSIEVLGIVYTPKTREMRIKDEFISKTKDILNPYNLPNTPRELWIMAGTSFYVIYALGICPARFYQVYRLLGRIAVKLEGAPRKDVRWSSKLDLAKHEKEALINMMSFVRQFPTAIFEVAERPGRYIFTDASNLALGVVVLVNDRVFTMSRRWGPEELELSINSKEVIAAHDGLVNGSPRRAHELTILMVDSTSAFYDLVTGSSRCVVANQCVTVMRTRSSIGLMWVPTELMPADGTSREVSDPELINKIKLILNNTQKYVYLPKLI